MMRRTEVHFFALLRSGLWGTSPDFSDDVDWDAILHMAEMQTVSGVVFDGISKLTTEQQPPVTIMRKFYQTVLRIEQSHELLNLKLSEVVSLLEAEGIHSILLKGQGVALNYPNPVRRQCGDIDLYIGQEAYAKACEFANRWASDIDATESKKHLHFHKDGVTIELHRLADKLSNPIRNSKFQEWTQQKLFECKTWNVNSTNVLLPPVNFDALFIFNHLYRHFISGGIGLRQLCDWMLYLSKFYDTINKEELLRDLKLFGLLKPWQIFGCIVVDYLGLAEEKLPFFNARYHAKSCNIIQLILQSGNFGHYNPFRIKRPPGYLSGKWHSFMLRNRRTWQIFPISPADVVMNYTSSFCTSIGAIFKEKLTRNK